MLSIFRAEFSPEHKRKAADLRDLQARQVEAERRLRILQKRAELHS